MILLVAVLTHMPVLFGNPPGHTHTQTRTARSAPAEMVTLMLAPSCLLLRHFFTLFAQDVSVIPMTDMHFWTSERRLLTRNIDFPEPYTFFCCFVLQKQSHSFWQPYQKDNDGGEEGELAVLVRLRRANHPPLPSILLANAQSLDNKVDKLRARISHQRDTDSNVIHLTETWLSESVLNPAIQTAEFSLHCADRSKGIIQEK